MNSSTAAKPESSFMLKNIPLFFSRFSMSYFREDACVEYFINSRCSDTPFSSALIFSYNAQKRGLHVSRFYPELSLRANSRYLSAVCFYLLIHHCSVIFSLDNTCHISLETVQKINAGFYKKLGDFNFIVHRQHDAGNVVELVSDFVLSTVDTSRINKHVYPPGEIPFMK